MSNGIIDLLFGSDISVQNKLYNLKFERDENISRKEFTRRASLLGLTLECRNQSNSEISSNMYTIDKSLAGQNACSNYEWVRCMRSMSSSISGRMFPINLEAAVYYIMTTQS